MPCFSTYRRSNAMFFMLARNMTSNASPSTEHRADYRIER